MKKRIFTFWEPTENMPAYLTLCLDTWRKFLPDCEIIILNYDNLSQWLGNNYFDKSLYSNFSFPMQADAIRCAILYKYGGVWLDTDTIITSTKFKQFIDIDSDFILIGQHIGTIIANKNAKVLKKWLYQIKINISMYKFSKITVLRWIYRIFMNKRVSERHKWNFLGNSILDKILPGCKTSEFFSINKYKNNVFPEENMFKELAPDLAYTKFYFENDFSEEVLSNNSGIICLHNSWTPEHIKIMDKEHFLELDNTLAKVLKKILNNH